MSSTALPVLSPRERVAGGCCVPAVVPDLDAAVAADLAVVAKALADPTRLRIVDALRKSAPEALCQCELTPLFDMSQQALSKHLKVLVSAGVLGAERGGVWTYHYLRPEALTVLQNWLAA
jgi:ArsR family transcriptional regulator